MNKEDIEIYLENGKYKLQDTVKEQKVVITRKLQDLTFPTLFLKHFWQNALATLIISILFCVLCSILFNFASSSSIEKIASDVAFNINEIKSSNDSSLQQEIKITSALLDGYENVVKDDNLIKDACVSLFNITKSKIEFYSTPTIKIESDEAIYWYRNEINDDTAMPIVSTPQTLVEFINRNEGHQLVITKMSLVGRVLNPETVEARNGKKVIETWNEVPQADKDRSQFTKDVAAKYYGTKLDSDIVKTASEYKFTSNMDGIRVEYPNARKNYKSISRQFTTGEMTYEVNVLYDYAGIGGYGFYIAFCIIGLCGIAVLITFNQVKKEKDF